MFTKISLILLILNFLVVQESSQQNLEVNSVEPQTTTTTTTDQYSVEQSNQQNTDTYPPQHIHQYIEEETDNDDYDDDAAEDFSEEDEDMEYEDEDEDGDGDGEEGKDEDEHEHEDLPPPPTPRVTIFGAQCDIPFMYKGEKQYNCFWGHDAMEYCKVMGVIYECKPMKYPGDTPDQNEPQTSPAYTEFTERYTVDGVKCSLPKEYNGRLLTDCLYVSANQEICYAAGKWHYCAPLDADGTTPIYPQTTPADQKQQGGPSDDSQADVSGQEQSIPIVQRYTTGGKLCVMPFIYNGEEQYDCVMMPDKKEWCFMKGDWVQCAEVGRFLNPAARTMEDYDMYQSDDSYLQGEDSEEDSESQQGPILIIVIVLVLVVLLIASVGGYFMFRRSRMERQNSQERSLIGGTSGFFEMGNQNQSKK